MKKYLVILAALIFCFSTTARGDPDVVEEKAKEKQESQISKCVKYPIYGKFEDTCIKCHTPPNMKLKEVAPDQWRDYPNHFMQVLQDKQGMYGYFTFIDEVTHDFAARKFYEFFRYLERHKINRAVIEIQSFGGSVFEGWRVKGIIDEFQCCGMEITTKVHSIAASAATLIFLAADNRVASPTAELMFHELWTLAFLKLSTPSDSEDEARILRHIQDGITAWVATRGKLSKEEIDNKIRKKEFWVNGKEALDLGFATKLIGG
jgi:ATP-dependent protease ClpP protease subunit